MCFLVTWPSQYSEFNVLKVLPGRPISCNFNIISINLARYLNGILLPEYLIFFMSAVHFIMKIYVNKLVGVRPKRIKHTPYYCILIINVIAVMFSCHRRGALAWVESWLR